MKSVKDTQSFIHASQEMHGDTYDYSKVEYGNSQTYVTIICPEHGEFRTQPVRHLCTTKIAGRCPVCHPNGHAVSCEKFIERAQEKHGDQFDYSLVDFKSMSQNITLICKDHGEFESNGYQHLANKYGGCKDCDPSSPVSLHDKIIRSRKIHGDKYDYSKIDKSAKMHQKVEIICKIHGPFSQSIKSHILKRAGCPRCAGNARKTTEEFIAGAIKVHGDRYDYSKVNYICSATKVIIICKEHGEFTQQPGNHLGGHGCMQCNREESKGERAVRIFLEEHNISFEREKRFKTCRDKKSLPFDFFIPSKKLCIEYDGNQHYDMKYFTYIKKIKDKEKAFKTTQYHDMLKNEWCKENDIELIRIKYDEKIADKLARIL